MTSRSRQRMTPMYVSVSMEEIRPIRASRRCGSKWAAALPATGAGVATNAYGMAGQTQIHIPDIEAGSLWASRGRVHNRCTERRRRASCAGSPRPYRPFRNNYTLAWERGERADPAVRRARRWPREKASTLPPHGQRPSMTATLTREPACRAARLIRRSPTAARSPAVRAAVRV